jgi:hypothetical protein
MRCVDGIQEPNLELAGKAAGNELRAAVHIARFQNLGFRFARPDTFTSVFLKLAYMNIG